MRITELEQKVRAGEYRSKLRYQQLTRAEEETVAQGQYEEFQKDQLKLLAQFKTDLRDAIETELEKKLQDGQFEAAYDFAYDKGGSSPALIVGVIKDMLVAVSILAEVR